MGLADGVGDVGVLVLQNEEWFTASVDLIDMCRIDDDGRPEWNIDYAPHGTLPRAKVR